MATQISELGKVAFVERLLQNFGHVNHDDAAVIKRGNTNELIASSTMLEGVDFDLQYFPLKHLGYKAVTCGVSNICAMNGTAQYITLSLGLSARFTVEDVDAIYEGLYKACEDYKVELVGGNTSASLTGLTVATTCIGQVSSAKMTLRSGAQNTDILCITGNLGAAYMGLQLLEREKRALSGNSGVQPSLEGYKYIVQRQLMPVAREDVVKNLAASKIVPTSMIDITRGLASAALTLCHRSKCGVRIYLERLPIAVETFTMAEELHCDPVVAALNGGDDYELLFTVPLALHKQVSHMGGIDIIGHVTESDTGAALLTPDGSQISLTSPDFTAQKQEQ